MAEPTYTLDEAREILRREICLLHGGHAIEQNVFHNAFGVVVELRVHCARCGTLFRED